MAEEITEHRAYSRACAVCEVRAEAEEIVQLPANTAQHNPITAHQQTELQLGSLL